MATSEDSYWSRESDAFDKFRERTLDGTYRDWQPTKWQSLATVRHAVLRHAQQAGHPILRALELGCGSATLLFQLAMEGVRVTGVDRDGDALRLAHAAADSLGVSVEHGGTADLECADFMMPKTRLSPADLVLSIGVIEHYQTDEQADVLARHAQLSKRWVLIAVPNLTSPLFSAFIDAKRADGELYEDEHIDIDVPALVTRGGWTMALDDGCHVFLSLANDRRFAGEALQMFERRLRGLLIAVGGDRYAAYPDMDLTSSDIPVLQEVEGSLSTEVRREFGFLRWYLIDCSTT